MMNSSPSTKVTDWYSEWDLEAIWDGEDNFFIEQTKNPWPPLICAALYLIVIFGSKAYMENRSAFNLRTPLFVWSSLLAIYSIVGAVRVLLFSHHTYATGGMHAVICDPAVYTGPIARFWAINFAISKFFELFDTVFIVLRKQKLIFLHWYHHITVMIYVWICYSGHYAGGLMYMLMNFIVHAMMYTYYAIRAYGLKLPRQINLVITTSQIVQMLLGCWTVYKVYMLKDGGCRTSDLHFTYGMIMYASYLVLFANFFYNTYIKKKNPPSAASSTPIIKNLSNGDYKYQETSVRRRK